MFYDLLPNDGLVCAHRGARSMAPENTLLAVQKAVECGSDFWETDVHVTSDGELVIFHDQTLKRTTDISQRKEFADRRPWKLDRFTAREMRSLDAGSWFIESDPYGTISSGEVQPDDLEAFKSQRVPLLDDALFFTKAHGLPVNLEIKDQTGTPGDAVIVSKILEMLRSTGTEHMVLLSSFNHDYLAQAKSLNPNLPTAALVEKKHPHDLPNYLKSLGVSAYNPDQAITKPELIRELRQTGFRVNLWTVNDMDRAKKLIKSGASAIITDWPQRLRKVLDNPQ